MFLLMFSTWVTFFFLYHNPELPFLYQRLQFVFDLQLGI